MLAECIDHARGNLRPIVVAMAILTPNVVASLAIFSL